MPTPDDIDQQQRLLATHRRTLADYLRQRAIHGEAYAPPAVGHGIREACAAIQQIKATLRSWGETVEDHPDDQADQRLMPSGSCVPTCPPPLHLFGRAEIIGELVEQAKASGRSASADERRIERGAAEETVMFVVFRRCTPVRWRRRSV
jgi:hypothetical protein